MKQLIIFTLAISSFTAFGQVNDKPTGATPPEKVVVVDNPKSVDDAKQQLDQAQKAYQAALKQEQDLRNQLMNSQNQADQARATLRKATLAMNTAQKKANPIVVEQYQPPINPVYNEMSMGSHYGLSTFIEGTETSGLIDIFSGDVDKEFKAYLKQFKSGKIKKQKGELLFDNIIIPEMSNTTIDLYVDFKDQENGVNILTYFDMGTQFLDTNLEDDRSVQYARRLMDNFARYVRGNVLENEIKNSEKSLEKAQKDLEDAKNSIQESREEIHGKEAQITESRNRISEIEANIDSINDQLERSRLKYSKVK